VPITADNAKVAKDLSKVAEVRDSSKFGLNARFAVVDSEEVMFMLLDDKSVHPNYDVAIWLSTDYFAKALEQIFEVAWKDFIPLARVSVKAK
jgi:hypothetical protein